MTLEEWEKTVPKSISDDILWKQKTYRLSLYAAEVGWDDVIRLSQNTITRSLSDQLYRSLGSISANYAEGFSRSSYKDQVRFYEYSLGSARESRDWYYKARHILGEAITEHRLDLIAQIIRLLLTIISAERGKSLREDSITYSPDS